MKFSVIIPTWKRPDDTTPFLIKRAINSVLAQTCEDWKIFLIGDAYSDEDEFKSICKLVPADKLFSINLPVSIRDECKSKNEIWCNAGVKPTNYAINLAEDIICLLDDDDRWRPNHLEVLDSNYNKFPGVGVVYTQGFLLEKGRTMPRKKFNLEINNRLLVPNDTTYSAVSWKKELLHFKFRTTMEQGRIYPSDADMWERMSGFCQRHKISTLYVPIVTVLKSPQGTVKKYK